MMHHRTIATGLLAFVAAGLASSTAHADRDARIDPAGLVLSVPDTWTAEELFLKEGLQLTRGGAAVASVEVLRGTDCDEMMEWALEHHRFVISPIERRGEGWIGRRYTLDGSNRGDYCRAVGLGGPTVVVWIEAREDDIDQVVAIVDRAIARAAGPAASASAPAGATSSPPPSSAAAWASTREVRLAATTLTVAVPAGWTATVERGLDTLRDAAGVARGELLWQREDCDALLEQGKDGLGDPRDRAADVAGWRGIEGVVADGSTQALFCRDVALRDGSHVRLLVASMETPPSTRLVAAAEAAIQRYQAAGDRGSRRAGSRGVVARFLPDRHEIGLARVTDGPADTLDIDRAWGPTIMVERFLYDRGLALGYKARATPTGAAFAGYAEAALGASAKGFSVQGVAGVGGAGEHAPFGVHAGVHAGLLLPNGLEAEGGYAWTSGGTMTRFEGRFVARVSGRRALSFGIGYERREGTQIFTIDLGTIAMPDF